MLLSDLGGNQQEPDLNSQSLRALVEFLPHVGTLSVMSAYLVSLAKLWYKLRKMIFLRSVHL